MKKILIAGVSTVLFAACGNSSDNNTHQHNAPKDKTVIVSNPQDQQVTINLYAGDDMTYSTREIRIKPGQEVKLILTHTGKMPKSTMGHNFVLLQKGVAVNDFANEAMKYQDNDFIPKDTKDIIAHTKMLGGGEVDSVTFKIDEVGVYNYLCSFTGHSAIMRGKVIVE